MVDGGLEAAQPRNGEEERRKALWDMYDRMKAKMFQDVRHDVGPLELLP